MKFIIMTAVFFSFSAFSHFEIGTYRGLTPEGVECSIVFEKESYTTPFKNPLSERVEVSVPELKKKFELQHMVVADELAMTVVPKAGTLEGVIPFQGGAEFLKVVMIHSPEKDGPDSFVFMSHNWKANKSFRHSCAGLVFQE